MWGLRFPYAEPTSHLSLRRQCAHWLWQSASSCRGRRLDAPATHGFPHRRSPRYYVPFSASRKLHRYPGFSSLQKACAFSGPLFTLLEMTGERTSHPHFFVIASIEDAWQSVTPEFPTQNRLLLSCSGQESQNLAILKMTGKRENLPAACAHHPRTSIPIPKRLSCPLGIPYNLPPLFLYKSPKNTGID